MIILGIESSCDETGLALFDTDKGLLADALYSQVTMHQAYGGVVPELASRDHIKRVVPLLEEVLKKAHLDKSAITAIAYTKGPGLAGALLVGASVAASLGLSLNKPILGVHHLEGHLLSPLLTEPTLTFPFVALLVSGGHTQLIDVVDIGQYTLLGETVDDAAGEAFDKSAKLLGLPYPGGAALSSLAQSGQPLRYMLPRPMLHSKDLHFSFSGLKTAVLTLVKQHKGELTHQDKADIAHAFTSAFTDVMIEKCSQALEKTERSTLVVAGGVGANIQLREALNTMAEKKGYQVYYPALPFCTDNGAMIAFAGAMRLKQNPDQATHSYAFDVLPKWPLHMA